MNNATKTEHSDEFISLVVKKALRYMGAGRHGDDSDPARKDLSMLTESAVRDLLGLDSFRFCYERYSLAFDQIRNCFIIPELELELPSEDLNRFFEGCDGIMIVGCTLGVAVERLVRKLQLTDMSYSAVVDSTAGALLECLCDEAESEILDAPEAAAESSMGSNSTDDKDTPDDDMDRAGIPRTFRFAPGYGDLPLALNIPLAEAISMHKRTGVSYTAGGLFVPQKSMLGIIGTGRHNMDRDCGLCTNRENCSLRKEGERCWI